MHHKNFAQLTKTNFVDLKKVTTKAINVTVSALGRCPLSALLSSNFINSLLSSNWMTWNNSEKVWSQVFSDVFIGLRILNMLTLTVILTFRWPPETSPAYFQADSFWTFLQSWERTGTAKISVCLWLRSCPHFQNYRILCGEVPRVYSHYH